MATTTATRFADLPLHDDVQRALARMHFDAPSPIQLRALPLALFGNDVVGQAKSGTGKTAVFGVTAVEHVIAKCDKTRSHDDGGSTRRADPLVLVLAPTREIALQIDAVLQQLAHFRPTCSITTVIGGLPIAHDKERLQRGSHIVVGTPGRVKALVEQHVLLCHALRLLVLDEVDKLLQSDFEREIQYVVTALPARRQTLAFSATFTTDQLAAVASMMRSPQIVRVRGPHDVSVELVASQDALTQWTQRENEADRHKPELWLRDVRQFYSIVSASPSPSPSSPAVASSSFDALDMHAKVTRLASLLAQVAFDQCIVFCNDKLRAEALATALAAQGWPATSITGSQSQAARTAAMEHFRSYETRVLVSTDLTARGIDVDRVNFVVNLDLPRDPATYLHRVGRTGRFGGRGVAITLLTAAEADAIAMLARVFAMRIDRLDERVPRDVVDYVTCRGRVDDVKDEDQADAEDEDKDAAEANGRVANRSDDVGFATRRWSGKQLRDDDGERWHKEDDARHVDDDSGKRPTELWMSERTHAASSNSNTGATASRVAEEESSIVPETATAAEGANKAVLTALARPQTSSDSSQHKDNTSLPPPAASKTALACALSTDHDTTTVAQMRALAWEDACYAQWTALLH